MSNYGRLALWQTALILDYVAPMLKLLLGWGLALKDALVHEIRDVVHHVVSRLSLSICAVLRRRFRRRSLRNSSGVLGCVVHVLGNAARRCPLSLALAPFDAKSLGGHIRSQPSYSAHALVSSTKPKHIAHVHFGTRAW
jgi:hypothetical protein